MSAQKFTIPGELMALNEYTNACRGHWAKGNKVKREQTELVAASVTAAKLKPYDGPVEIGVKWVEGTRKRRQLRDVDNIAFGAKFILDALVECGVIPDDNPRIVRNVYHHYRYNADDPHVEVVVMDYDPSGRKVHYTPITGLD